MKTDFRCICPITTAIDIVGDKWTLVIIKQMLLEGKKTFKDFTESDESIATNILSSRLKMLEEFELISKEKILNNKKTNIYLLTDKGLGLIPTIVELTLWSDKNLRGFHPGLYADERLKMIHKEKEAFIKTLAENYKTENWPEQCKQYS
ncbi:MAG: DNA-binding HxlR family transcriptional regulator [Flavobacteriales bacterium]|jgi:DNA-binding HxlR family transcriptional regulator